MKFLKKIFGLERTPKKKSEKSEISDDQNEQIDENFSKKQKLKKSEKSFSLINKKPRKPDPKPEPEPEPEPEPKPELKLESEPEPEPESETEPKLESQPELELKKGESPKHTEKSIFKRFFSKEKKVSLEKGLEKTSTSFFNKISKVLIGKTKVDDEILDDLEDVLISSDVGVKTTLKIIDKIESRVAKEKYIGTQELDKILNEEIINIIASSEDHEKFNLSKSRPHVILVVGVNGVGKTTSIGKMAHYFKSTGLKVVIGAADTFRAAAIEQLEIWANRVGVDIVKQEMGSDPASVAYDTLASAKKKNADVVLIDTAGRLHNKVNLMNELSKIKRVLQKIHIDAPQEVVLIIDGSTGQNAFEQAKQFTSVTEITSLAVTKLDGTAKGGVVLGISDQLNIPIKFIGVGEGIEDLQLFDKKAFVDSFFKRI